MRVALVRWRAEQDGELTTFVPDVDLDALDAWGVIDLRGSGEKHQSSADGVALLVAPRHEGPVPGALVDLGDDHQSRLGTPVARALSNRLGLNLVEATPGRIAAELLTLHARADDDSKPNPLVGERRFPRSKSDQRRRARVWCAGVLLYDELGAHVDEEMAYYAEMFPTAGALTSSQDLPWDSSSDPFTVASGGAYALPGSAGDAYQRMATAHSSADHFAEIVAQLGDDSLFTWVGPIIRAETSNAASRSYGAQIRAREFDIFAYSSGFGGAFIGFGSTSLSLDTDFTARLEGDGSTIRLYINGSLAGATTNSSYSGVHAGISAGDSTTPDNARIYSFATALNGEEPGGGDDATALIDRGQKNTTAGTSTVATVTSDAFTPAEGAVVAVIVGGYLGNTTLTFDATDTFGDTDGGTWQEVTTAATGSGYTGRSSIFWRRIGTNPSSGTVTITRTPSGSVDQWMTATFVEVEGTEGVRLGVRQSKTGTNASSSLALTFDDQVGGDSLVLTGVTSLADTSITTPAGFTLLDHVVGASSSAASAHGTDSPTWTGLGSFVNAGVAVEIAEAKSWCLVTLHGAGNNTSVYGGTAPHPSGALYDTRPVQGPVVLGSGSYDWSPDWFGNVTFPNWSTIEALLESAAEGYDRVAVAGFSAGGAVAIEMLRQGFDFDGRLVGVILDDPAGPVDAAVYDNPNGIPVALYMTSPDGGSTWNQDVAMEALGVFDHLEKLVALAGGAPTLNPHSTSHAPMMVGQSDYAESADEDWWQPGGGGTTVEGEATATLGALTGAATGVRSTAGTGTSSLGGLTGAATGVATVVGEASSSLGGLSATATGTATTPPVEGTATANLGALTGTASGTTTVVGTATSTLGGLTGTATGTVQGVVNGQATANLGALTGTATGVRATAGTAAATLGDLTATADGQPTVVGEAAAQLGGLTGTATGGKTVVGQAAAHLGGLDGHAVGEGATTVEGEATANLGGLTGTAAGVRTTAGTASSSLGGLTAAGTGQVRVLGAAATVLGGVTAEAAGDVIVVATATAALGGLTGTGTGTRTVTGAATAALGALTGAVVIVTADPNPLSVTIRETGHRVVARDTGHRVTTKERR